MKEGFLFVRILGPAPLPLFTRTGEGELFNFKQGGNSNKEVPHMRVKVTLRCNECKQRNYNTVKNKKNTPDKLELNKYCPFCRKHTVHSETK